MIVHGIKVPVEPHVVSPIIWRALQSQSYAPKDVKRIFVAVKALDRRLAPAPAQK